MKVTKTDTVLYQIEITAPELPLLLNALRQASLHTKTTKPTDTIVFARELYRLVNDL